MGFFPQVLIDFTVIINALLCYSVYGTNEVISGVFCSILISKDLYSFGSNSTTVSHLLFLFFFFTPLNIPLSPLT